MRISDWSSDVCSSDLAGLSAPRQGRRRAFPPVAHVTRCKATGKRAVFMRLGAVQPESPERVPRRGSGRRRNGGQDQDIPHADRQARGRRECRDDQEIRQPAPLQHRDRSEEHTSELQSLMRISYAVFFLQKKNKKKKYSH